MNSTSSIYVQKEEARSEKIASITQITFLAFVFAIYHLSPKGFSASEFEPVRVMFYVYGPILLARLFLAWKERLKGLILYAFLAIDLFALTLLIWSFHIQYQQPVTLSLRAPTFLYFFIFLAVRGLSYDYKKLLFVLVGSVALWASVVIYVISFKNIRITSNFSEFLQPNTVIIGIEIDKVLALMTVGSFLLVAIIRKRRLLQQFAIKTIRETTMERLIGKRALSSFELDREELLPGRGIRRNAATMMVDLRGFSKLSYQISPELVLTHLGEYQKLVAEVVFKNNGSIDKYLGDGVLAHFGAVDENSSFASEALTAAEGLIVQLGQWRQSLNQKSIEIDFGIAVTVGEVIFGVIGHEERMEITTIGESVNLSAKLEKHTKELKCRVLTTKKTFETAKLQGFTPTSETLEFSGSQIAGIPHTLDIIGLQYRGL